MKFFWPLLLLLVAPLSSFATDMPSDCDKDSNWEQMLKQTVIALNHQLTLQKAASYTYAEGHADQLTIHYSFDEKSVECAQDDSCDDFFISVRRRMSEISQYAYWTKKYKDEKNYTEAQNAAYANQIFQLSQLATSAEDQIVNTLKNSDLDSKARFAAIKTAVNPVLQLLKYIHFR